MFLYAKLVLQSADNLVCAVDTRLSSVGGGAGAGAGAAGGSTFASGFAGAPAVGFKEGGQIKKKTKKKKRVVRGVGAAKRGYGKATYSKKMY